MKTILRVFGSITMLVLLSCSEGSKVKPGQEFIYNPGKPPETTKSNWLIPEKELIATGAGRDGVKPISFPALDPVSIIDQYLNDWDLVVGIRVGDEYRAYTHTMMNYHEIVNDVFGDAKYTVTYSPFTGSAIVLGRVLEGRETTFGNTGFVYNSNLVFYDRLTDSYWSQMKLVCVNGGLMNTEFETYSVLETSWGAWKAMFPDSQIM